MTFESVARRVLQVVFGYLGAVAVAAVVTGAGFRLISGDWPEGLVASLVQLIAIAANMIAIFAALPALVCVAVCEFMPWRSWHPYTIALFGLSFYGADAATILLGLAGGAAAGWTYWRIAGKDAGLFRKAASL